MTISTSISVPPKAVAISDIGAMLQAYTKLVSGLQDLPAFSKEGFGYTEWMILRLLAGEPELKAGGLAGRLGLSTQRTAQILGPLRKNGYLKAAPEAGDTRKNTLSITSKGQAQLDSVDQAVMAFFDPALKTRPKSITIMRNFARVVMKYNKPVKQKKQAS
jgi:DNA-binding MarR family transcriptional regulator